MKILPKSLVVGYCNWGQADDAVLNAVRNGVNVLIWFSINLGVTSSSIDGKSIPCVDAKGGPDMDEVNRIMNTIKEILKIKT